MATWLTSRLRESAAAERAADEAGSGGLLGHSPSSRLLLCGCMIIGALGLGLSLRIPPGEALFHIATVGVACWWLLCAQLFGWGRRRVAPSPAPRAAAHQLAAGIGCGLLLLGVFLLGALGVSLIPVLRDPAEQLLEHAGGGAWPLVAAITVFSGICEEAFFRGPVYSRLAGRASVIWSSVAYALVTAASGIWLLALAALLLGLVCGMLRRLYRRLWAPVSCHLVWSLGMLFLLAPVLHSSLLDHWRI